MKILSLLLQKALVTIGFVLEPDGPAGNKYVWLRWYNEKIDPHQIGVSWDINKLDGEIMFYGSTDSISLTTSYLNAWLKQRGLFRVTYKYNMDKSEAACKIDFRESDDTYLETIKCTEVFPFLSDFIRLINSKRWQTTIKSLPNIYTAAREDLCKKLV